MNLENGFKNKYLLIISRLSTVVKEKRYFFPYQDGKYIDDIGKNFAKVKMLCPVITEKDEWFNVFKGYKYQFSSNIIELISLFEDNDQNRSIFFNMWKLFRQYKQIKSLVKESDIVFVFMPTFRAVMGVYLAKKMNKKVVLYSGSDWFEAALILYRWNKWPAKWGRKLYAGVCGYLENWAMKHCALRIVNGYTLIEKYKALPGVTVKTIPLTHIEKNNFYFREKVCEKIPIKLLSVGAVIFQKGYEYLIEAVHILKRRYPHLKIQLSFAGDFKGDNYEINLRGLIEKYHLREHVFFMGYIGDRRQLLQKYREADIFVISSILEGFPRVIWEAMSQGLPVVASNITNIKGEFKEYRDVVLFAEQKNSHSFAEQIFKVINDKKLCEKIRENAKCLVTKIFYQSPAWQFMEVLKSRENKVG